MLIFEDDSDEEDEPIGNNLLTLNTINLDNLKEEASTEKNITSEEVEQGDASPVSASLSVPISSSSEEDDLFGSDSDLE